MSKPVCLSLAPGFSRVSWRSQTASRFNGLSSVEKPLKRFSVPLPTVTGLKPGANERPVAASTNFASQPSTPA